MNALQPVALVALVSLAMSGAHAGEPAQAWAHREGVLQLGPNGAVQGAQNALDRSLIVEAFARWGVAYDEAQLAVVRTLFTRDATFEVLQGSKTPIDGARGIDEIVRTVANALKQQNDQRRHAITNVVIDKLTAGSASAMAYGIVTVANDGLTLGASVIYRGDLVKEAGVWRFSRLTIGMDSYAGKRVETSTK